MDLAGVEIELARSGNHLTRLRETLAPLRESDAYDYCIMDTPPSLGVLMTSALAACDEVLTPLQCEWFGLEGLAKILHVTAQICASGANPRIRHEGVLMTMYDGRTNLSRQVIDQVEQHLPVGPCERYGELGRENVVFLRPVRQTGEVTGVARRGCGRFLRRGVGDHFAARQLAAVGRNILLRRQRAAREECYDRKNTPHIFAFLTFIFAARRNEFPRSAPA